MRALVGLAPSFSDAAADIYRNLVAFQLEVNNLHVVLRYANGEIAVDTTVAVAAGQDSVVLQLSVPLTGAQEVLTASIELRDGDQVLFSGTQNITVTAGVSNAAPPPIQIVYTGPGASAVSMEISPKNATISTTESVTFQATARDANNQPVPNLLVRWTSSDQTIAVMSDAGVLTGTGVRGTVQVRGELPTGVSDETSVTFVPPPTSLAIISGGGQTAKVGTVLPQPMVVEVRAADGLPVPGTTVVFAVTAGGGSVSPPSIVTDANGRASATFTLGTVAGPYSARASVGVLTGDVPATATPDNAAKLAMTQQPSASASSGTPFETQPKVQLQDAFGNTVPAQNIAVTALLTAANGRILGGTTTANTNAAGVVEFTNLNVSGPPGVVSLTFAQDTLASAVSSNIEVTLGAPTSLTLDGAGTITVTAGAAIANPPSLVVTDAGGNGIADVELRIVVTSGGATLKDTTVKTDATGRFSLGNAPAQTVAGQYTMTASNATLSGSPVAIMLTVNPAAAARVIVTQRPSSPVENGTPFSTQPVARISDAFGNTITASSATVGATVTDGVTLTGTTNVTAASGIATFTSLGVSGASGLAQLTFASAGLASDTASVTVSPGVPALLGPIDPAALTLTDSAGASISAANLPSVIVKDASHNPVPGVQVKFRRHGGMGSSIDAQPDTVVFVTTDAAGKAALTGRRLQTLPGFDTTLVTAPGLSDTVRFAATVTHASASSLAFIQQPSPAIARHIIVPAITVEILDQFSNRVTTGAGATAAATLVFRSDIVVPPVGAILGPTTAETTQNAAAGLATFSVSVSKAGTYVLGATSGALSVPSNSFAIQPAPAAQIVVVSGNEQGSLKGAQLAAPLKVKLLDTNGDFMGSEPIEFEVLSGGGNVSGHSSDPFVTATSDLDGIAQTTWDVGVSGVQKVRVTHADLTPVEFRAYIAEKLLMAEMPNLDPPSGVGFTKKPKVQLADADSNPVRLAGVLIHPEWTLADMNISFGSGDTLAVTDANGLATFENILLEGDAGIPFRLVFKRWLSSTADPGIDSALTDEITLSPGLASSIFTSQEYNRLNPSSVGSFTVSVSDGYNKLPGHNVKFVSDTSMCGIATDVITTGGAGQAEVTVGLPPLFTSCVVSATLVSPPAGHDPSATIRIAVAPVGIDTSTYRVWTGARDSEWTNADNWFQGQVPRQRDRVFIPRMRAPNATPKIAKDTSTGPLMMEPGSFLDLARNELYVGDTVYADGEIIGDGIVALGRPSTRIRGNIRALVEAGELGCPSGFEYFVDGTLNVNEIIINCALTVNSDVTMNVARDLRTQANADHVGGELNQSNGTINVGGKAVFDGRSATLGGGLLNILGDFSFTGDGDTRTFNGSGEHILRMSGEAPAEGLSLTMNGLGSFATVQVMTRGSGLLHFASASLAGPTFKNLQIAGGATVQVPTNWSLVLDAGGEMRLEEGGILRLIMGEVLPDWTCTPIEIPIAWGDNRGPMVCIPTVR
ncbi:MAG: Ig-like domain-containing protein [Gemmatimonadaceae bacterium]